MHGPRVGKEKAKLSLVLNTIIYPEGVFIRLTKVAHAGVAGTARSLR